MKCKIKRIASVLCLVVTLATQENAFLRTSKNSNKYLRTIPPTGCPETSDWHILLLLLAAMPFLRR
jgi:hypothetical protein